MTDRAFWSWLSGVALSVAATAAYILYTLQFRFGGYDLSPLIDSGWRVLSGEVPNRNFICTFPPLLYLGAAAAFRVLGVHWLSLSVASVAYTLGLTLLGARVLLLLRPLLGSRTVALLCAIFAALQLIPFLLVGHPWHSSWTEAAVLYALLATFALAATPATTREPLLHLALAETLLVLAKPNTALPTLALCTLVLLLRPGGWRKAPLPLVAALLLSSALLHVVHTSLLATYRVYFALSLRLGHDGGFDRLLSNPFDSGPLPDLAVYLAVFPAFLWLLLTASRALLSGRERWAAILALGSAAITVLGLGTNVEFRIVDVPALLLGATLLAVAIPGSTTSFLRGVFAQGLVSLVLIAFFFAENRTRMIAIGAWASPSCGRIVEHDDAFFGHFHACAPFFSVLAQTDAALEAHPGSRTFFGPEMEFLYAREHLRSPDHLPLWWHPGSSFPYSKLPEVMAAWQSDRFDTVILPHNEQSHIPPALRSAIDRDFHLVTSPPAPQTSAATSPAESQIDVYIRR